jgi:hypothetical protein
VRRITPQQLQRLRHRHQGYLITLGVEVLLLLLLPVAAHAGWLLSLMLVSLAVVLMVCLSRYSSLKRGRPLVYGLGTLAIALEVAWHVLAQFNVPLARPLTVPHVIVWLVFLTLVLFRKVKSLVREPYVTVPVVMGAAGGYLMVGIAGGLLLTALWVFHPGAFSAAGLPSPHPGTELSGGLLSLGPLTVAPALMAAAINLLTTVGSPVLNPSDVAAQVSTAVITVTGQLYVAILIALILGRFHQRRG